MFEPRAWKLPILTILICLVQIQPVNAQNAQTNITGVNVQLTITEILEFEVDPISLTYTLDAWSQFDVETDIGAIEYTLSANQPWQIDAIILDDDDDWDDKNWTLTVNDETVNETTGVTIDSLGTAVHRADALWEVQMNKVVYILHGLGADSQANWFPWLKRKLEEQEHRVIVPDFPQSSTPQLAQWLEHLQKMIQQHGEGILVGHSLGGLLAIQYLLAGGRSSKVILTATPFHAISGMSEITAFLPDSKQLQRLANIGTEFVVIQSDDDALVPIADGRRWAKILGGKFIKLTGLGHLTIWEFPEILPYL